MSTYLFHATWTVTPPAESAIIVGLRLFILAQFLPFTDFKTIRGLAGMKSLN